MNNEPVAWILENNDEYINITFSYSEMREWEDFLGDNEQIIPLYTHPVKELTDEEIEECWFAKGWQKSVYTKDLITLAREILRKAQEK